MTAEQRVTYQRVYRSMYWWFLGTALLLWGAYGVLMLALGGRNSAYGSGWQQWNYWRWMLAPHDVDLLWDAENSISDFFFLWPATCTVIGSTSLLAERVSHGTARSTRIYILGEVTLALFPELVFTMSKMTALRFWWFAPHTVIPMPAILFFQIAILVAWLSFPFLAYWLAIPMIRRCEIRFARAAEKSRLGENGKAIDESKPDRFPLVETVRDYAGQEERARRSAALKNVARKFVTASLVLCLALNIWHIRSAAPAIPASSGVWTRLPLECESISSIVIDPLSPSTLYVSAYDGIFRSEDSGKTWTRQSVELAGGEVWYPAVRDLAVAPSTPSTLYAAMNDKGILRSVDGGTTWTATGITRGDVESLAVNPVAPSVLYASTSNDGVFRITDDGKTCVAMDMEFIDKHSVYPQVYELVFDPLDHLSFYANYYGDIFHTADGGTTWKRVDAGLRGVPAKSLAIDPLTPTTLYAGATYGEGVLRSADSGKTWMPMNSGLTNTGVVSLAVDPANPTILYAGTNDGIFRYNTVPSAG